MSAVTLIQGTMQTLGGYRVDGVDHVGEDAEALVDEAKEIAYATGRPVEVVLARLLESV